MLTCDWCVFRDSAAGSGFVLLVFVGGSASNQISLVAQFICHNAFSNSIVLYRPLQTVVALVRVKQALFVT